jgi:hypothetical protein
MDMRTVFVSCWYFNFESLAQEKDFRLIDVQKDVPDLRTGSLIVYMEVAFDYSATPPRPHYSGKYLIRRVSQSIRKFDGIKDNYVILLLDASPIPTKTIREISAEVHKRAKEFDKSGGHIPLPR